MSLNCELCGAPTDIEPIYCCTGSVWTRECNCGGKPINEDVLCENCVDNMTIELSELDVEFIIDAIDFYSKSSYSKQLITKLSNQIKE